MFQHAYAHTDGPNQSRDVILHFSERCESPNDCTPVWTVWLGASQEAEFHDQFEAMRFARSLADERQLPAWMLGPDGQGLQRLGN
jgi:hypothetical protein